jgi:hypothetical protein
VQKNKTRFRNQSLICLEILKSFFCRNRFVLVPENLVQVYLSKLRPLISSNVLNENNLVDCLKRIPSGQQTKEID